MNKATLNSITTFIPVLAISIISIILMISPNINAKEFGVKLALTALPIQGLVIIFRKEVFSNIGLQKKKKYLMDFCGLQ